MKLSNLKASIAFVILCAAGTLTYAYRVAEAEGAISQKKNLMERSKNAFESVQNEDNNFAGGFAVDYEASGKVLRQLNADPLEGKNLFQNPDTAAIFHKCAGRAMRGGGYTTFMWPNHEGFVCRHVAYTFAKKGGSIVTIAEPRK